MNTKILFIPILALLIFSKVQAQCASLICPPNINTTINSASCDAIVNFISPVGVDPCNIATTTFNYTGDIQTWVVPAGVYSITVDAYGAQGGAMWVNNTNFGGHVHATIPVIPGATLNIYVGGQPTGLTGGWNGGGNGEVAGLGGAGGGIGGGGASDIRIGGNTLNNRVIVAGAGGGAGFWNNLQVVGGAGGGLVGGNGFRFLYLYNPGGAGGTQTSSGFGTCTTLNNPICAGGFGFGGSPSDCGCDGFGGGGGWFGGGGSGNCRGGGGGSSYTNPIATNVTHNQGIRIGDGKISISYLNIAGVVTSQINGLASGSAFPKGITTNTFQTVSGNDTISCSFNVTVLDLIAPSINAPANASACTGTSLGNISPSVSDNCDIASVTYIISGATTGNGLNDATGTIFNTGVSTVRYYASDNSGNIDSVDVTVTIYDLPTVTLALLANDTVCLNNNPFILPTGTPISGIYSGNGVSGLNFDPSQSGVGTHGIVYTFMDNNGCSNSTTTNIVVNQPSSSSSTVSSIAPYTWSANGISYTTSGTYIHTLVNEVSCDSVLTLDLTILSSSTTLTVTAFIEGYYIPLSSPSEMVPALYINDLFSGGSSIALDVVDLVMVELVDSSYTTVYSAVGELKTNGQLLVTYDPGAIGGNYYIKLVHHNTVNLWSASLVTLSATNTYNFSTSLSSAATDGSAPPMANIASGLFGMYSGDINKDGFIDGFDFTQFELEVDASSTGLVYFLAGDMNGDGFGDGFDFPLFDANAIIGIYEQYP